MRSLSLYLMELMPTLISPFQHNFVCVNQAIFPRSSWVWPAHHKSNSLPGKPVESNGVIYSSLGTGQTDRQTYRQTDNGHHIIMPTYGGGAYNDKFILHIFSTYSYSVIFVILVPSTWIPGGGSLQSARSSRCSRFCQHINRQHNIPVQQIDVAVKYTF